MTDAKLSFQSDAWDVAIDLSLGASLVYVIVESGLRKSQRRLGLGKLVSSASR